MIHDQNNQAILLLCSYFSGVRRGEYVPLTPAEYGRFASWLQEHQYQPKDLIARFQRVTQQWDDPKGKITIDRLKFLLGRGVAMGIALEKWSSAGIWILTRANTGYPGRLKKALVKDTPAVLFGLGNQRLLNAGGLAIVGSRSISSSDHAYARRLAQSASNAGMNVVSGGAKGVDETAMLAALEVDGTALGMLANGLLSSGLSAKWRPYLKSNDLCLVSPYSPEAAFQVGNAMGRNKYIYCLADHALVVRSDKGRGGTWAGAIEALKNKLAPVFVRADSDAPGNAALIELRAVPLEEPTADAGAGDTWLTQALQGAVATETESDTAPMDGPDQFYAYFVQQIKRVLESQPAITLKELKVSHSDLTTGQITNWLGRAVADTLIERPGKAHKYRLKQVSTEQQGLFDSESSES